MSFRSTGARLLTLLALIGVIHCGAPKDDSSEPIEEERSGQDAGTDGELDAGTITDAGVVTDAGFRPDAGPRDGGGTEEETIVSFDKTQMEWPARAGGFTLWVNSTKAAPTDIVAVLSVTGAGPSELTGFGLKEDGRFELIVPKGSTSGRVQVTLNLFNSQSKELVFAIESIKQGNAQIDPAASQLTVTFPPPIPPNPTVYVRLMKDVLDESNPSALAGVEFRGTRLPSTPVKVTYTLTGTATRGSDYNFAGSTTFTLKAGTFDTHTFSVIDDDLPEDTETIVVTVTSVEGAELAEGTEPLTITILDNDSP